MVGYTKLLPFIFCSIFASIHAVHNGTGTTFNVISYGAVGDGTTKDTEAIRKAATALASAGGGILLFPSGGKFLTGSFNLTSHSILLVESGATILGSEDEVDYPLVKPLPSYGRGRGYPGPRYESLVGAYKESNITITGGGVIDGQGSVWWDRKWNKTLSHTRPRLAELQYVDHLHVHNITLQNSAFWTLHPIYCTNVLIENIKVAAPVWGPETDCIDIDSSQNVMVRNVDLQGGDDCIAIKSGWNQAGIDFNMSTSNVTIQDSRLGPCGAISFGSETSGGVHNVTVKNIVYSATDAGIFFKSGRGRGGTVKDVTLRDLTFDAVAMGIYVSMYYTKVPSPGPPETTPHLENIVWENITGNALSAGEFRCLPEAPCTDLLLKNVHLNTALPFGLCEYVHGTAVNVTPTSINDCLNNSSTRLTGN